MMRIVPALLVTRLIGSGIAPPAPVAAQVSDQLGIGDELDCEHFLAAARGGQDHAERFVARFPDDPYDLDLDSDNDDDPCETESDLGTGRVASCANFFSEAEGGQKHAQALLDIAGPGVYDLDANGNGVACDGGAAGTDPPSDLPPTSPAPPPSRAATTIGCDSTLVENGRVTVCVGQFIETRPFDFAAFAASAQDGFGRFSGSGSSGPISIGVSSAATASSAGGTTFQPTTADGGRVGKSEQRVTRKKSKQAKHKRAKDGKPERNPERRRIDR